MTSSLVDSNIFIDLLEKDSPHARWSGVQLGLLAQLGPLVINQIVYAELAVYFEYKPAPEMLLGQLRITRDDLPWAAAHLAGHAHVSYRRSGGQRHRVLTDFLIGAHAAAKGFRILTRDGTRYRNYFPQVEVIAPDTHP